MINTRKINRLIKSLKKHHHNLYVDWDKDKNLINIHSNNQGDNTVIGYKNNVINYNVNATNEHVRHCMYYTVGEFQALTNETDYNRFRR